MQVNGGEYLMLLRTRLGKTQKQIGQAAGVSDQAVSDWERGKTRPRLTPYRMRALCKELNCTLDELAEAFPEPDSVDLAS